MTASHKTIYILRHAKAETADAGTDDHDRALTQKGRASAENLGEVLKREKFEAQRVISSTSTRTRETVDGLEIGLGRKLKAEYTQKLYLCSPGEILNILRALPEDVQSVLLVGHNPGMHQFCLDMAGHGDEELLDDLAMQFPTCAFAKLEVGGQWASLAMRQGTLVEFLPHAPVIEQA